MRYTERAETALILGADLARAVWTNFAGRYPGRRLEMRERLEALELSAIELPEAHGEYREAFQTIVPAITQELSERRCTLGEDGYAYPLFLLGFYLHFTIASFVLGEGLDALFEQLAEILLDLNVDPNRAQLQQVLEREAGEIKLHGEGADATFSEKEVFVAWARMTNQIMDAWRKGTRRMSDGLPSLGLAEEPLFSCFISYSFDDEPFVERLFDSLTLRGVKVWEAKERTIPGKQLEEQIEKALASHQKLVLVISAASVASDWVSREILTARKVGEFRNEDVLVPITLMDPECDAFKNWDLKDAAGHDVAASIRPQNMVDFRGWDGDSAVYDKSFEKLLRGLQFARP